MPQGSKHHEDKHHDHKQYHEKKLMEELKYLAERIKVIEEQLAKRNRIMMKKFRIHHKILFSTIVFIGFVLIWYGVWTIISSIPILDNPYIATGLGMILLLATGMYYGSKF